MENVEKKDCRLVFNPGICRALLKRGCTIVDVKADRMNHDKSIFAFKNDENFEKAFAEINEELKERKEQ